MPTQHSANRPFVTTGALTLWFWCALTGCGGGTPGGAANTQGSSTQSTRPILVGLTNWAQQPDLQFEHTATPGYVDDNTCIECHSDIAHTYEHVSMSQAFFATDPERMFEDLSHAAFYHEPSDQYFDVVRRGDDFIVRRYQKDEEDIVYNLLEQRIDYVLGSGMHTRTYVYRTEVGELYQLPVAWFTETEHWGIHPGFDTKHHGGFTRMITRDCMSCHNAYPQAPAGSDRLGQPHLFPSDLPEGIGCQRCHGPGAEHLRVAGDFRSTRQQLLDSIVNPAELEPAQRDSVCNQCHFQPASLHASRLNRFGEGSYAFAAGELLTEFAMHIDFGDEGHTSARFESNHHAYRLYQSPCYIESGGEISCLTCHDPHVKVSPEDRAGHYRAACLTCHTDDACSVTEMQAADARSLLGGHIAMDDCVSCHMPSHRPTDVVNVTVIDHYIRPAPPTEDLLAPLAERLPIPGEPRAYWEVHKGQKETPLYLAIADAHQKTPGAIDELKRLVHELKPDAIEPYAHLGTFLQEAERFAEATDLFAEVTRRWPDLAMGWTEYGRSLEKVGRPAEAKAAFEKSIGLGSNQPENYLGLGTASYYLGDVQRATMYISEAIRLRQMFPDAHFTLGAILMERGDTKGAIEHLRQALAIDPQRADGYIYLGLAQRQAGDTLESMRTWRRAWRMDERNVPFAEGYALGLLDNGRFEEALGQAQFAIDAGGDRAACLFIAALAQHGLGNLGSAREAFAAAGQVAQAPARTPTFVRGIVQPEAMNVFLGSR